MAGTANSPFNLLTRLSVVLIVLVITGLGYPAAARDPLLVPGKSTLFQRVLTRPDAKLTSAAGDQAAIASFPAFEIFYVYGDKTVGDDAFIEVGRSLQHGPEGWMARDATIEWRQAIVLGFNNPAGRARALIFKTKDTLSQTLSREDVAAALDQLRSQAASGQLPSDSPIISIEPSEYVDIENQFYVLPILEAGKIRLPTNISAKLLRIASVPERPAPPAKHTSREEALRDFRIGITFVIDTTQSMQPYIDEVRNAIAQLRDSIAGSPEGDRFRFGLVAFRDNITQVPALDYVTKVVLPLDETATAERFVEAIDQIKAAKVSSTGFDEDSIAGIRASLDSMNWEPFGGRLIILVTDAGPRTPGAEAAAGDLAPAQLQPELERKQIALMTLHLKSQAGRFDHESAEQAYRAMSRFNGRENYFPIENADPNLLREQVTTLATRLQGIVSDAIDGRMAESADDHPSGIAGSADVIGRAMQLAYLGDVSNTQAPDVFEGWLTDRDAIDRGAFPVTPFLLMSRNELSSLRDVIAKTIDIGTNAAQQGTSDQFFTRLREAVALMSVRPDAVQDAGTLGDLLGEYLEGLPYTSEIINLTPEDWRDLSPVQERQLLDTLRSKVVALEKIHSDERRWHALSPDAPAGEYVSLVPLTLMP